MAFNLLTHSVLDQIGNTPMMRLEVPYEGRLWRLYAKLEFLNPSGSVKDRIAKYIIEAAEQRGELQADSIIVEATSGNTGIGLAMVAAVKHYRLIIVMPEHMSLERQKIIASLGAEICLTPRELSFAGARERTLEMAARNPKVFLPRQFENPDNIRCHRETTAVEILEQMAGRPIDVFVDGVGTAGTLMGVGQALRERYPACQLVAVEPAEAAILSGATEMCEHLIAGIGDGFVPELLDTRQISRVIAVPSQKAIESAQMLSRQLGLLIGISSGANIVATIEVLNDLAPEATVVTVLPDRAERYFSTGLFDGTEAGQIRRCSVNCENPFCDFRITFDSDVFVQ